MTTNYEHFLGTPEKAAATIQSIRHFNKNMAFELAWLNWYGKKSDETSIEAMPNTVECMAEFLESEFVNE